MRMAHKLLLGAVLLAGAAATLGLVAREGQSARWQPGVFSELAHGSNRDFDITAQARMSPRMPAFGQAGRFPTYRDGIQLAGKHPLLQWLREYLRQRPKATLAEGLDASTPGRGVLR